MKVVLGVAAVAAGAAIIYFTGGGGSAWAAALVKIGAGLITAGAGMTLSGIGTLISGSGDSGSGSSSGAISGGGGVSGSASVNPIAPHAVIYGRTVIGGTVVYEHEWGNSNKYLDMVVVLAAHPCASIDRLLFNKQFVQLESYGDGTYDSFQPLQQTENILHISRTKGVITVILAAAIPLLTAGDRLTIDGVSDLTMLGRWPVESVSVDHKTFTYLCGGSDVADLGAHGSVTTTWADYERKVHMEVLLGDHVSTFPGMLSGTPNDGDTGDLLVAPNNPWTAAHLLQGKTAVFLRLHYDEKVFSGGLPQISFLVSGKNDIYDPRLGAFGAPATTGYTENAALVIADYLANQTYGFKATYGSEIPIAPLIAAADICDEAVSLAIGGTEPRYALNGKFDLSVRRGEILQNLLTACAGRLTYQGGQFIIWPAAWNGSSPLAAPTLGSMSGPFRWKPTVSIRDLYNGVKGTYISPANNWQASDVPAYAQDVAHGYASDANLIADGNERRWLDIQLPFTISPATAQRLCKIELLRRRHQGTGTFRFNMTGYSIAPMDVVTMDLAYFGWSGKQLEVLAHRFTFDRQGEDELTLLGTEIDVQETDADTYDWSTSEELSPQGYQQPAIPDGRAPAPPTGLTLQSDADTAVVGPKGKITPAILVSWTAPTDGYVTNGGHIEVRYQLLAASTWTGMPSVNPSVTKVRIVNVTDHEQYTVSIRSVNAGGTPSDWVTASVRASGARRPLPWRPFSEIVFSAPFRKGVDLAQRGGDLEISGYPPVNRLSPTLAAPVIDEAGVVTARPANSLPTGDWIARMYGIDSNGLYSPASGYLTFGIVTSTSRVTFAANFPAGTVHAQLFIGRDKDHMLSQATIVTPVSGNQNIDTISYLAGYGPPDTRATKFRVKAAREVHGGRFVATVTAATSTDVTISVPSALTVNSLVNAKLSLISKYGLPDTQTGVDFTISANDAAGLISIGNIGMPIDVGDLVLVRTYATSATSTTIRDTGWVSPFAPTGLSTDQDKDKRLMILYDPTGSALPGDTVTVLSNTSDTHTVTPFPRTPGAGTAYIIVEPADIISIDTKPFDNVVIPGTGTAPVIATIPAADLDGSVALVWACTLDEDGNESIQDADGLREMYIVPSETSTSSGVTVSGTPVVY
jgi:hypothetical protein